MRADVKEWLLLLGKSVLLVLGGILAVAALVDISVIGWNRRATIVLLVGLALAIPPLAFAFRDALREAKKGRI